MVGAVEDDTGFVVMLKVAVEDPGDIVTLPGTVAAAVLLLDSVMTTLMAAVPVRVTVPVELLPPSTLIGLSDSVDSDGARTVMVAARLTPLAKTEMDDVVFAGTGTVVTGNVAVRFPAATVTVVGTRAAFGLLLARVAIAPPVGAGPFRVTVAVEELPPMMLVGFKLRDDGVGAVIVNVAILVTPL